MKKSDKWNKCFLKFSQIFFVSSWSINKFAKYCGSQFEIPSGSMKSGKWKWREIYIEKHKLWPGVQKLPEVFIGTGNLPMPAKLWRLTWGIEAPCRSTPAGQEGAREAGFLNRLEPLPLITDAVDNWFLNFLIFIK